MLIKDISQISTIPVNEDSLEIRLRPVDITQALKFIEKNGTTNINLPRNCRPTLSGVDLSQVLQAIQSNWVTSIDLSRNHLALLSGTELIEAFTSLSAAVTSLSLSWNDFHLLGSTWLTHVIQAIPRNVTRLDLRGNHFERLTSTERDELIEVLLGTGKTIQLNGSIATEFRKARLSKLQMYGRLFDEEKSDLTPELVNEIFEFNYPKSPSL